MRRNCSSSYRSQQEEHAEELKQQQEEHAKELKKQREEHEVNVAELTQNLQQLNNEKDRYLSKSVQLARLLKQQQEEEEEELVQQQEEHANELKKQREEHEVIVAALKRDEAALMRCHLATLLRESGRGTQ
jgi:hypothetical protein